MGLFHKLHRLRRVSKSELPRLAVSRAAHWVHSSLERWLYTVKGPRFQKTPQSLQSIGLFHPDPLSTGFSSRFRSENTAEADSIVKRADQAVEQVFDLLGSGPMDLKRIGENFWHTDFKSGHRWNPHTFFTDIPHDAPVPGTDIKVPWGLSRCQHFVTLAQASCLTGDIKYVQAFSTQLESWIRSNPPKYGVNWVCSMDVALRACNWLAAWDIFQHSPGLEKAFRDRFSLSLWEHGSHIYHHLEWGGDVSTNHYLSNLLGLVYIGLALDQKKWIAFAQDEFSKEIFRQTYDDGFDYEGSTSYHRLALEIFFFYALLCQRNEGRVRALGSVFLERLGLMFEAVLQLSASDGTVPSIGDNDSGRVHVFFDRDDNDMAYLSGLGAVLLDVPSLKIQDWSMPSELPWLFGLDGSNRYRRMRGLLAKTVPSKKPSQSGLLTLRGPSDFLVFSAAPNGTRGVGGHTHNDKLSFCLWMNGEWFLIDPGTGVYTPDPELRNRLRSTRAHNTVAIDGKEQNTIRPESLFALADEAFVSVDHWERDRCIRARHTGYRQLRPAAIHHREIRRESDPLRWVITDNFEGTGSRTLQWTFVMGPGIEVSEQNPGTWQLVGQRGRLKLAIDAGGARAQRVPGIWSPCYGIVKETARLEVTTQAALPCRVKIILESFSE